MFQKAKDQATNLAARGADFARIGGEHAQNFHSYASSQAADQVAAFKDAGYGLTEKAGEIYQEKKKESTKQLFDMAAGPQKKLLFALREVVKDGAVSDPHMCESVKTSIKDAVDLFWVDLEVYLELARDDMRDQKTGKMNAKMNQLESAGENEKRFTCGLYWWRAKVLYALMPFDISIFGQVKNPLFWILTVLSCMTLFGVRIMFFATLLTFIVMGRPADEFQLTQYILTFKGLQFISSGVALGVVAAVKYYMCVGADGRHTCDVDGPGATQGFVQGMVDWVGSCVLVWVAFLFLPCSDRTAGIREIGTADAQSLMEEDAEAASSSKGCCGQMKYDASRGGRLKGLLRYDLICFIFSFLFMAFLMYCDMAKVRTKGFGETPDVDADTLEEEAESAGGHQALFWARMIYSFTAFPFVIYKIPGIFDILTHTVPTGYNRNGKCVPFLMRQEIEK